MKHLVIVLALVAALFSGTFAPVAQAEPDYPAAWVVLAPEVTIPRGKVTVTAGISENISFDVQVWVGGPAWSGELSPQPVTAGQIYWSECTGNGCTYWWSGVGPARFELLTSVGEVTGTFPFASIKLGETTVTADVTVREGEPVFNDVRVEDSGGGKFVRIIASNSVKVTVYFNGSSQTWLQPAGIIDWLEAEDWSQFEVFSIRSNEWIRFSDQAIWWEIGYCNSYGCQWVPDKPYQRFIPLVTR